MTSSMPTASSTDGLSCRCIWWQFFLLIFVSVSACLGNGSANRLRSYMTLMVRRKGSCALAVRARRGHEPLYLAGSTWAQHTLLPGPALPPALQILVVWMLVANQANMCSRDKGMSACPLDVEAAMAKAAEDAMREAGRGGAVNMNAAKDKQKCVW